MSSSNEYLLYSVNEGPKFLKTLTSNIVNSLLNPLPPPSSPCWLDIYYPDSKDFLLLYQNFHIHPLTIEDIQQKEPREKCEVYEEYIFVSIQLLDEEEFYGRVRSPLEETVKSPLLAPNPSSLVGLSKNDLSPTAPFLEPASSSTLNSDGTNNNCNIYLLIMKNLLITLHWIPIPFLSNILNRRLKVSSMSPLPTTLPKLSQYHPPITSSLNYHVITPDWIAYLFLDEIVDDHTRQVNLLQEEVDAIEDLTMSLGLFDQIDMLRRIYQAHRRVTILTRLSQPKEIIIKSLIKRGNFSNEGNIGILSTNFSPYDSGTNTPFFPEGLSIPEQLPPQSSLLSSPITSFPTALHIFNSRTILYLRDIQDHLHSLRQSLLEYTETLSRAHDTYLGQADIELAMASHKMNLVVKKLTAMAFLAGVVMAISSIMGMNLVLFVKWEEDKGQIKWSSLSELIPFILLMIVTAIISIIVYYIVRKKSWL